MQLACKHCGAPILADDINLDHLIARCRQCHAVFSFEDTLHERASGHEPRWSQERDLSDIPIPKRYDIEQTGVGLQISYRWFSWMFVFLLFFCIVWNGFLFVWYSMTGDLGGGMGLLFKLFPLIHVAAGVGLTYYTIAGFCNRTLITVRTGALTIQHTPVPWPGNHRIPVGELEQLYCKEKIHNHRSRHGGTSTSFTYELHAVRKDGRSLKLMSGLQEPEEALFLERTLEDHLGILDRPIAGEMR